METQTVKLAEIGKMTIKETGTRNTGVTDFIRMTVEALPDGKAIPMKELADMIVKNTALSVNDKRQSYVRITHFLNASKGKYVRFQGESGKKSVYVGRNPSWKPEDAEETASPEVAAAEQAVAEASKNAEQAEQVEEQARQTLEDVKENQE